MQRLGLFQDQLGNNEVPGFDKDVIDPGTISATATRGKVDAVINKHFLN
jgi:hypothetical protein